MTNLHWAIIPPLDAKESDSPLRGKGVGEMPKGLQTPLR